MSNAKQNTIYFSEAPFRNVFATRSSTKGSWGAPHRTYAPDTFSETGTNESVTGGLFKTRPKGRSDFQDSAWYDNRGATSADTPESRGSESDLCHEALSSTKQ